MTPAELVRYAKSKGLAAIALSDHDVVDGLDQALAEGETIGMKVVPAVELSVKSETETHILGYNVDYRDPEFLRELEFAKDARMQRNYEYTANLAKIGFDIPVELAASYAGGGIIARAHYARAMVDKGYAKTVKEAFDLYLANGCPGYSSLQYFSALDAVRLIKKVGGYAFVAHLHLIRRSDEWLCGFLTALKHAGLDGVEGYYTEYTEDEQARYQALAASLGLKLCGGTDFHGANKPQIEIGTGCGSLRIPYELMYNIGEK